MTYAELVQYYQAKVPQDPSAPMGTDAGNNRFNAWTSALEHELGIPGGNYDDPSSGWANINPAQLDEFEVQGGNSTPPTNVPIEQGILQTITPGLINQINGDAGRQQQVTDLTNQTNAGYGNLRTVLGQTAMTFDGQKYFQENPDVAAAFNALPPGSQPGTRNFNGHDVTANQFAEQHYQQFGQNEGRQPAYTSSLMAAQNANVDRTTQSIIDAARTGAASTTAALGQLTADQLANLATSLTTQRGAIGQLTTEQLGHLEQSIATQRQALQTEVDQLKGNASTAAQARLAALDEQLKALTAAQGPVSEARIRAAEGEATGINLGLESTRDQISADAAREGFVGPSSFTDASLARAAIDARQGAARTLGAARVANAGDDRDIARLGATSRYSIKDVLAGDTQRAGDYGAGANRALTGFGAETGRGIRDAGSLANAQLTGWGAETGRGINDAGATGRFSIASALANNIQGAQTNAAGQRSAYFDQLYPNAVNSAQILAGLPAAQAQTLTSLIPYGTAGTRNALDTLNWWSTNATPPNPTAVTTSPNQNGNQVAGLGAGLFGSAFQIGNANNWWQPRSTTTQPRPTTPGGVNAGGANLYTSPIT